MTFEAIVYLAGPLSLWSQKPHKREIIARRSSRWLWLAHSKANAVLSMADSGRCGYVIMKDGAIIHHTRAPDEQCNPLRDEDLYMPEPR